MCSQERSKGLKFNTIQCTHTVYTRTHTYTRLCYQISRRVQYFGEIAESQTNNQRKMLVIGIRYYGNKFAHFDRKLYGKARTMKSPKNIQPYGRIRGGEGRRKRRGNFRGMGEERITLPLATDRLYTLNIRYLCMMDFALVCSKYCAEALYMDTISSWIIRICYVREFTVMCLTTSYD